MGYRKDLIIEGEIKRPPNLVEDALKESEEHYRRLFETAQDGIVIIDADTGRITDVNPYLLILLGHIREHFIGKAFWDLGPFRDIRKRKEAFQDLIQNGYIRYDHLPLETKKGKCIEVEFICNAYKIGQKRYIQCNIRDNSLKNAAERNRIRLFSQNKDDEKMEAIATLAGGIAHQFNNALTIIQLGLELMEEDGGHPEFDELKQQMNDAAKHMSHMTVAIMAYAGGGKYSTEKIRINCLVEKCLTLIRAVLNPSITFETELTVDSPQIYADIDQMQLALLAILTNASEAIGSRGKIRIVCRKEMVTDEGANEKLGPAPGIYACISVEDSGDGVDEETKARIFEPFFTTKIQGRGLGMAAAHGVIINHGGRIDVQSELGKGTVVNVMLPAACEEDPIVLEKQKIERRHAVEPLPDMKNEANG